MSTLAHLPLPARTRNDRPASLPTAIILRLRRSRSLASMLPALLFSGVMTLAVTVVMHAMWDGVANGFAAHWMESWLTAWPIAFPIAYVVGPMVTKVAAAISAPAEHADVRVAGLGFGDIAGVSQRVTLQNRFTVLRGLQPQPFRAETASRF